MPYETQQLEFPDMKKEPYTSINPNGRVPAIEDPNTGITLWESSAIIDYLLETYDKTNSLQCTSWPEKFLQKSWMALQISGQGPYYGQRAWFLLVRPAHSHPIAICGAADCAFFSTIQKRISNLPSTATATSMLTPSSLRTGESSRACRVHRVIGVINSQLKKTGKPYLVGDKCTYADLAFVSWHWTLLFPPHFMGADFAKEWETEYPEAWAWHQRLQQRPAVTKVFDERLKAIMASKH